MKLRSTRQPSVDMLVALIDKIEQSERSILEVILDL